MAILILGVPIEGPWIQGTLVKMMKRVKENIYPPGPKDTDEHDGLEVGEFLMDQIIFKICFLVPTTQLVSSNY